MRKPAIISTFKAPEQKGATTSGYNVNWRGQRRRMILIERPDFDDVTRTWLIDTGGEFCTMTQEEHEAMAAALDAFNTPIENLFY